MKFLKDRFHRSIFFSFVILFVFMIFMLIHVVEITPESVELFQTLFPKTQAPEVQQGYEARQWRAKTSKTLLLSAQDERKIGRLTSNSSELIYAKDKGISELIEKMEKVNMVYQESLGVSKENEPEQVVVTLQADRATYFYSQEKLIAENAEIKRYVLSGHILPQNIETSPSFKGTAARVTIGFASGAPVLQAEHLKAAFPMMHLKD